MKFSLAPDRLGGCGSLQTQPVAMDPGILQVGRNGDRLLWNFVDSSMDKRCQPKRGALWTQRLAGWLWAYEASYQRYSKLRREDGVCCALKVDVIKAAGTFVT